MNATTHEGIPPGFERKPTEPGQRAAGDATTKASNGVTLAKVGGKQPDTKAAKKAERKAAKAAAKGKVVEADHKPSTVTATDANPQKSIVPVRFKQRYAETGDSCGDRVALAFKTFTTGKNADGRDCCDLVKLTEVATANGIDMGAYAKCNVGQKRMNVGNRLRGMLKNEKAVVIGKQRFADWEKAKLVEKANWAKPEPKAKAEAKAA